jgi:hypothetical protein
LPGYEFCVVAGTVLSETVFSGGPGYYAPLGVNPKVRSYREFRVRQEDGTEVELSADANQVQLGEGQRVTLVVARSTNGYGYVMRFWNHDAPQYSGVVQSTLHHLVYLPGDGCLESFLLAFAAGKAVFLIIGIPAGLVAGGVAGVSVLGIMIARSLRKRARRRRKLEALRASVLEHLSRIAQTLALPAGEGKDAAPAR